MRHDETQRGFTLIELLLVILIVGVLAAIALPRFLGPRQSANVKSVTAELVTLRTAIVAARLRTDKTLFEITSEYHLGAFCNHNSWNPDATHPADLASTHPCWTKYISTISKIEAASGEDLSQLRDGDVNGAPYYIDANENESAGSCNQDIIGYYAGRKLDAPNTTAQVSKPFVNVAVPSAMYNQRVVWMYVHPHSTSC